MARHIMAVCVVCLLCADRLPCQQHIDNIGEAQGRQEKLKRDTNTKIYERADIIESLPTFDSNTNEYTYNYYYDSLNGRQHIEHRRKRHADHVEETHIKPEITKDFLNRILISYGYGNDIINATGFQNMLKQLGLHKLIELPPKKNVKMDNNSCITHSELVQYLRMGNFEKRRESFHHSDTEQIPSNNNCTINSNGTNPCNSKEQLNYTLYNYTLNEQDVLNACPVLLYQLALKESGCIDRSLLADIVHYDINDLKSKKQNILYVWIYAFISVFACGILGLVGVAIIPFMDSRYYKHIIQFLVSLAVGTMTGDALLHLLPHSLSGQNERNMILKGLVCMSGIIFFYITEHGLTMISEWRKRVAKKETKKPSRAKVVRDPDSSVNNSATGDKVCKSKYSSYPYCYDEIAMDTKNDVWLHLPNNVSEQHGDNIDGKRNGKAEPDVNETATQSLLSTSQNNYAPIAEVNQINHHHQQHHHRDHQQQQFPDSNTISTDLDGNSVSGAAAVAPNGNNGSKDKTKINETVTVILREHESSHHGHSHKHGHVHSPPDSLSSVVWMIIMGDGLHNFTDGMAIGAAFAENIAGGFSTSLAVFCHELPHELGDFAILIKAGMSVKSAVYYNLLTGILSFIGMICGIVFGQSQDAAQWMFAAAAGLFIYIALVDMMPELSATHKSIQQFVLQVLGMSTGVLLMLLIALYESDLMTIFSTSSISSPGYVH